MMSVKHVQCAQPSAKCGTTVKAYRPPLLGGIVLAPALTSPGIAYSFPGLAVEGRGPPSINVCA